MKRVMGKFFPTRSQVSTSASSLKKSLKFDNINLVEDFYIELTHPHKSWAPGEIVTGTAALSLKKNITNINITLTLLGYIKIKPAGNPTGSVRGKPVILFNHTAIVYGHDPNEIPSQDVNDEPIIGLSNGEHRFPFSMKLPKKNIYTSISFERGSISYTLRASINHNSNTSPPSSLNSSPASSISNSSTGLILNPRNSIHHCEKSLQIVVPINVAKIPKPQTKTSSLRMSDKKLKKTLSSTSTINSNMTQTTHVSDNSTESNEDKNGTLNTVKLSVDLPQSGYLRGELIPLKVKVQHYKAIQSSNGVIVSLIRVCRLDGGPESSIQSFRKDLSQVIIPLYIDPETLTSEISTSLRVPADAFPTIIGSNVVSFQYYIEVLANVSNRSIIVNNSSQSTKNSSLKFTNSIVFDIDSSHDREIMSKSENGMINVDKLKRAKNLLGLNTEIVIGTERRFKKKENIGNKTIVQNIKQQNNDGLGYVIESDCSVLEAISQTSISPLSITNDAVLNTLTNNRNVSTGEENQMPNMNVLSEKDILRMKEEALLPSEPIFDENAPAPSYEITYDDDDYDEDNDDNDDNEDDEGVEVNAPTLQTESNYTHRPSRISPKSNHLTEDKDELRRRRLQDLESEPPEFDYVPEYNPAGQSFKGHSQDHSVTTLSEAQTRSSEMETLKGA